MDSYTGKTERAFVVLMKRHNLTPLSIPGEEVTWYSDYAGLTDQESKWQGSEFHSSLAETNEEFVARRNRWKQDKISFISDTNCSQAILQNEKVLMQMREIKRRFWYAKLSY